VYCSFAHPVQTAADMFILIESMPRFEAEFSIPSCTVR
jgi:hypothetical protein